MSSTSLAANGRTTKEKPSLVQMATDSNDTRLQAVGEWLMSVTGTQYPREVQMWRWYSSMTEDGRNSGPKVAASQTMPNDAQYRGQVLAMDVTSQAFQDKVLADVVCAIPGSYSLSIDGVVMEFARGEATTSTVDGTGKRIINVVPKNQDFTGRIRMIDPRDLSGKLEWLFFWLHPMNFHSPCRIPEHQQAALGIEVGIVDFKYTPSGHVKARICVDGSAVEKARKVSEDADRAAIIATIHKLPDPELRKLAVATGIAQLVSSDLITLRDQYISHILGVVNATSGSPAARENLEKIKRMTSRGYDHYARIVNEAHRAGVIEMRDNELYLVSPEGAESQPKELAEYLVPPAKAETWYDWLATEAAQRRHEALMGVLERATAEAIEHMTNGRPLEMDMVAAVDRAIARELVTYTVKPQEWTLANGEKVRWHGKFGDKDAARKSLITYISSVSKAVALQELGISNLDDTE